MKKSRKSTVLNEKLYLKTLIKEDVFGFWFLASLKATQTPCLVICYRKSLLNNTLIKDLIRCADQLMSLHHPQLLGLLDYGYDGDVFYTVHPDFSAAICLDVWLAKQNKWPLNTLWKFSSKLLRLGTYLEENQLFFGCLSLSNLYVLPSNEICVARVIIPSLILQAQSANLAYLDDTLFYAPELYLHRRLDSRSDLYSFGVLLYYFFSRQWPYEDSLSIDETKNALIAGPSPFRPCHTSLPQQITYIVSTCLKLDPQNRYSSFQNLLAAYKKNSLNKNPFSNKEYILQQSLLDRLNLEKNLRFKQCLFWGTLATLVFLSVAVMYGFYIFYVTAIPTLRVPYLAGLSQKEASTLLHEHGFHFKIVGSYVSSNIPKNHIHSSKPPAGRLVKQNRHLRLFISKGLADIRVPDLQGMSDLQARQYLEDLSLRVSDTQHEFSNLYAENYVIGQSPSPNHLLNASGNITLILSKGFPIEVWHSRGHFDFFKRRSHTRHIKMKFMVLPDWEAQKVSIYFKDQDHFQKIYEDFHAPGNVTTLSFELELQGVVTIFFNDEKAYEKKVSTITKGETDDLPF
ncbi:MAG: PASTA domain-containing protein [bacterium]